MSFENPASRTAAGLSPRSATRPRYEAALRAFDLGGCIFALTPLAPAHRCSWPWLWRPMEPETLPTDEVLAIRCWRLISVTVGDISDALQLDGTIPEDAARQLVMA